VKVTGLDRVGVGGAMMEGIVLGRIGMRKEGFGAVGRGKDYGDGIGSDWEYY